MNDFLRRSAPSFRKTTARHKISRHIPWRLFASLLVAITALVGLGWFVTRRPRGYECVTNINTVCPPEIAQQFSSVNDTPLWRVQQKFVEGQSQNSDPRITNASLSISPLQIVLVKVELAEPVFPFSIDGENWQMLSNGKRIPSEAVAFPNVEFSSEEQSTRLSEAQLKELQSLYQRLRTFTPRIRKILVLTSTEVEVYPESTGKILFTLQDIERQLATLQAFFRSTTINQTYQVLDVRFNEVAVIKE